MVDLGREEGVEEVRTTTTTPVEVLVVVQDVAVAAVAEQEGDGEVHRPCHLRHLPGHLLHQTTYWTRTFSLMTIPYHHRPPDVLDPLQSQSLLQRQQRLLLPLNLQRRRRRRWQRHRQLQRPQSLQCARHPLHQCPPPRLSPTVNAVTLR
ncbi:hypothetical protein BDM02DRAFT_1326229 [Thelephora ganbajun]|uniref:Uncharacterized protein n=1 Tax=Thelephora ganbajun TaxID=370292 RepID=A0ACB6ZME2_THEGA|nr:hypothetical protein BDM02DRAFT_1326229 [Thelephora ganbajun]